MGATSLVKVTCSSATAVVDSTMTADTDIKRLTVVFMQLPPMTGDRRYIFLIVYHTPSGGFARVRAILSGHSIIRAVGRRSRGFAFSRVWKENPMPLVRYRITHPTIALFEEDGRHVANTIPAGVVVEIDSDSFNSDKLMEVVWEGKRVMMFAQDLRKRAEAAKGSAK